MEVVYTSKLIEKNIESFNGLFASLNIINIIHNKLSFNEILHLYEFHRKKWNGETEPINVNTK